MIERAGWGMGVGVGEFKVRWCGKGLILSKMGQDHRSGSAVSIHYHLEIVCGIIILIS